MNLQRTLGVFAVFAAAVANTALTGCSSSSGSNRGSAVTFEAASPSSTQTLSSAPSVTVLETHFIVAGDVSITTPSGMNVLNGSTLAMVTVVDLDEGEHGRITLIEMNTELPPDGNKGYTFDQVNSAYPKAGLDRVVLVGCGHSAYVGGSSSSELDLYLPDRGVLVTSISADPKRAPIEPTSLFTACVNK